jgi:hypothetical protein
MQDRTLLHTAKGQNVIPYYCRTELRLHFGIYMFESTLLHSFEKGPNIVVSVLHLFVKRTLNQAAEGHYWKLIFQNIYTRACSKKLSC